MQLNSFDWMHAAHLTLPLPMVLSKWQFLNQPTLPKNLLTCHQVTQPPHFDKGLQSTNPILARVYRVRIPFWQWFTGVGIPFWQGFTEYKSQFGKDLQSTNPILARVYRVQISFWQGFTEYESHFGKGLQSMNLISARANRG